MCKYSAEEYARPEHEECSSIKRLQAPHLRVPSHPAEGQGKSLCGRQGVGLRTNAALPQTDKEQRTGVAVPNFQAAFDCAPVPLLMVVPDDPAFTIAAANDAFALISGVERENLVGRSVFQAFPDNPAERDSTGVQRLRGSYRAAIESRAPNLMPPYRYDVERPQKHGGGFEERYWSARITPIFGANGRIEYLLQSVEEVTDKVLAEEKEQAVRLQLQTSEKRFRQLAETTGIGVIIAEFDGGLSYANPTACQLFGYTADEVAAGLVRWDYLTPPEFAARDAQAWQEVLATGRCAPYEKVYVTKDGRRVPILIGASLLDAPNKRTEVAAFVVDLTERRESERLRQQWHLFDTALSHTPDFIYTFDLEGRFTYVNRALLSLWQKPLEEARGRNFFELGYPPDLARKLQHQIQQVIDNHKPIRDRTPFTGPDGQTRHYEYIFAPVLGDGGQMEAVAGSTRDITEQKLAEELIEEDRRQWQALLAQTPAGIALLRGPEHRIAWVNSDYERLVGRSAEAILDKPVDQALPEVASQIYIDLLNDVYQNGKAFHGTEQLARLGPDPHKLKELYINFVYLPIRDIRGDINGIFVHVTDVTDMVVGRQQSEERERQFRTLAESIPNLAWMAHADGHIFWYNQRWYDYTGTSFADMEGWAWRSVHDPKVLPEVLDRWNSSLAAGQPFEMVFPLKGADGHFRSFLTRVEPVRDNRGQVVRWFGTNTDITDQQRNEQELRRINRELEEFAFVASHDLQEPLRMVNIYTQLLLRGTPVENDTAREYAGFVRQGVARMEMLIRDLLTYSRAVKTQEFAVGKADLSVALSETLVVLQNRIEEYAATIHSTSLPMVRGDTKQLAHVFQNLLSNALKYRKKGTAPEIHISAENENSDWTIRVRDNGIGFEPRYAQKIFGLFQRLHDDEYPGTGLGLAICQRIVERYGGRIWAEGRPGEGAEFFFTLPAAEVN